MELTRRELIEDFKPYKVEYEKCLCEDTNSIPLMLSASQWFQYDYNGDRRDMQPVGVSEMIARDCEQSIIGKQDWTPYDIDETKPYFDEPVEMMKRVIKTVSFGLRNYPSHYKEWQLQEAKLELISRN